MHPSVSRMMSKWHLLPDGKALTKLVHMRPLDVRFLFKERTVRPRAFAWLPFEDGTDRRRHLVNLLNGSRVANLQVRLIGGEAVFFTTLPVKNDLRVHELITRCFDVWNLRAERRSAPKHHEKAPSRRAPVRR